LIWIKVGPGDLRQIANLIRQRRFAMNSDLQLRQDVLDELEFEPSVNAAHIGVTANHGVVT